QAGERLRRYLQLGRWRRQLRRRIRRRSVGERERREDRPARAPGGNGVRRQPQRGQDLAEVRLRRLVLIIERNAGSLGRATGSKLRCRRLKNSCYRQPRCQTTDNEAACRGRLEG